MACIGRRLLQVVGGAIAALVLAVVALALLLQTGRVSRQVRDFVVPRASAALGRELAIRDAKLSFLPALRVRLIGAMVAGRPGEPPLAQLESLDVKLKLWPLVRSLGKDAQIGGVLLVKPIVNLVRADDGTWNFEGLGQSAQRERESGPRGERGPPAAVIVDRADIEDGELRILDRQAGKGARLALSKVDFSAQHIGAGEPLHASLSAALMGAQKNLQAEVRAARLPASAEAISSGACPEISGTLRLTGLELGRVRAFLPPKLTGIMTGGRLSADAKFASQSGRCIAEGSGTLSAVRLRGAPAQGSFALRAEADPAKRAVRLSIEDLVLKGPGVDLRGEATASMGKGSLTTVRFAIVGPLLDLGEVMGLMPAEPSQPEEQQPFALSKSQRGAVEALDVKGTIAIAKVAKGALVANDFQAETALDSGALSLRKAHASLFGGSVDASGTRVDLSPALPSWDLNATLDRVDLNQALTALNGEAPVSGKLGGKVNLAGAGAEWSVLKKTLTGHGVLTVKEGALTSADIGQALTAVVAQGLSAVGRGGPARAAGGGSGKTDLRDLHLEFTVKDGAMVLTKPLSVGTPFGAISLGGNIGLGGNLALQGTATLSRSALEGVSGASGVAPDGLPVPLGIGGTLAHPAVQVNAQEAVARLISQAAQGKAREVGKRVQGRVGDVLRQLGK